jgi:hypothetical protein
LLFVPIADLIEPIKAACLRLQELRTVHANRSVTARASTMPRRGYYLAPPAKMALTPNFQIWGFSPFSKEKFSGGFCMLLPSELPQ